MQIMGVYAALCVSDLDTAAQWYGKLIGRAPDHHPIPTMVQWLTPVGGIQLFHEPERAGSSVMTIVTPDLAAARTELAAAGLELGPESRGDFGAVAQIHDADGNRITLAEPPRGA